MNEASGVHFLNLNCTIL